MIGVDMGFKPPSQIKPVTLNGRDDRIGGPGIAAPRSMVEIAHKTGRGVGGFIAESCDSGSHRDLLSMRQVQELGQAKTYFKY